MDTGEGDVQLLYIPCMANTNLHVTIKYLILLLPFGRGEQRAGEGLQQS